MAQNRSISLKQHEGGEATGPLGSELSNLVQILTPSLGEGGQGASSLPPQCFHL